MKKGLVALVAGLLLVTGCTAERKAVKEGEKALLDSLKSPSTAEFCGKTKVTEQTGNSFYTVEGCVDAENGFGAMIRTDWTVELYHDDNGEWSVEDVILWADEEEEESVFDYLDDYDFGDE